MKRQIRQSIFETNSSSTHSIQVVNTDSAKSILMDKIMAAVEKLTDMGYDNRYNKEEMFENNDTLILKGFYEESGDESELVGHIIKDPIFKIQYLFGVFIDYMHSTYWYKKTNPDSESFRWGDYERNPETLNEVFFMEHTKEFKFFSKAVLDYLKSNPEYEHITKVKIYDGDKDSVSWYSDDGTGICYSIFEDKKKFMKVFNQVMDNKQCIMLTDEPYTMYGKPKMLIY